MARQRDADVYRQKQGKLFTEHRSLNSTINFETYHNKNLNRGNQKLRNRFPSLDTSVGEPKSKRLSPHLVSPRTEGGEMNETKHTFKDHRKVEC